MKKNVQESYPTPSDLKIIWEQAQRLSCAQFEVLFSKGLYNGINEIEKNKEHIIEELYYAAKEGEAEKFISLLDNNPEISPNDYYHGDNQSRTFLYTLIKHDTGKKDDPKTIGRQKIARYLIEDREANINLKSYNLAGSEKPSPFQMYERFNDWNKDTWKNRLMGLFCAPPSYGINIFPILKNNLGELLPTHTKSL